MIAICRRMSDWSGYRFRKNSRFLESQPRHRWSLSFDAADVNDRMAGLCCTLTRQERKQVAVDSIVSGRASR
jgi:hypothetical protein